MKQKLRTITEIIPGLSTGGRNATPGGKVVFKIINAKDIQSGELDLNDLNEAMTDRPSRLERYRTEPGDLLVVGKGTFKTAVVREKLDDVVVSSNIFIVRPIESVSAETIKAFLDSAMGQHEIQNHARGATIFSLNRADLGDIEIPVLPQNEQQRLNALVERNVAWRSVAQAAIEARQRVIDATILEVFQRHAGQVAE